MPESRRASQPEQGNDAESAPADDESGKRPTPSRRSRPKEIGGPDGPEPTRYGDWERNGRCSDF